MTIQYHYLTSGVLAGLAGGGVGYTLLRQDNVSDVVDPRKTVSLWVPLLTGVSLSALLTWFRGGRMTPRALLFTHAYSFVAATAGAVLSMVMQQTTVDTTNNGALTRMLTSRHNAPILDPADDELRKGIQVTDAFNQKAVASEEQKSARWKWGAAGTLGLLGLVMFNFM